MEESTLEIENADYQEMLTYIRLNRDKLGDIGELENLIPVRAFKFGRQPGMRNQMKDLKEGESKWIHVAPPVSRRLRRKILGKVVEIGIITLFTTFVYTFGGSYTGRRQGHQLVPGSAALQLI